MGARISAIEFVKGSVELSNNHFSKKWPDYDFDRFQDKVGIKKRYRVSKKENMLNLAEKACNLLLKGKNVKSDIDYLILCTQSPEHFIPTNSCILQNRLGLNSNVGCLDFNLGCSGYIYGLSLAKGLINSKQAKKIILVTSETYSRYLHQDDLINQLIFSDAASATLIEFSENEGIGNFTLGTDGTGFDKLIVKNNFFNKDENPKDKKINENITYNDNCLFMNGPEIFKFTIDKIPNLIKTNLTLNETDIEKLDYFILHQANKFLLNSIRKKSCIPENKFVINFDNIGNTISSTIPIALKQHIDQIHEMKEDKKNLKVFLCGFGVGLSWGAVTINLDI